MIISKNWTNNIYFILTLTHHSNIYLIKYYKTSKHSSTKLKLGHFLDQCFDQKNE